METIYDIINRDFGSDSNPAIINKGILDTIKTIDHSILSIGLRLVKIKTEKLYVGLGFFKMSTYIKNLVEESQKDRSSIYKWLKIGEVYIKHRKDLEKEGFTSKDGPSKLLYLEIALKNNPKNDVYENLIRMTHREFVDFAKKIIKNKDNQKIITEITNDRSIMFYYGEKEAVRINKNIERRARKWFVQSIKMAFEAMEKNSWVLAVHLKNRIEFKKFKPIVVKARAQMREEMKEKDR